MEKKQGLLNREKAQSQCLQSIREALAKDKRALVQAATGFGKSYITKKISETLKGGLLIVAPRINLVDDLSERIPGSAIFCASLGKKDIGKVTIATKQSLTQEVISQFDFVALDEVHGYNDEFLDKFKDKFVVGFSATPWTENGPIYGEGKFFKNLSFSYPIETAIKEGILSPYKLLEAKSSFDLSMFAKLTRELKEREINEVVARAKHEDQVAEFIAISNYKRRKKVVLLCANIEHAQVIHAEIEKYEKAQIIHSKLKNSAELVKMYKHNDIRFCVSVLLMSEGTDIARVDGIYFLRPSKSSRLMVQACGRGLRLDEEDNSKTCLFLDYGSVFNNCGLPDKPLIPDPSKKGKDKVDYVKRCELCYVIYEAKCDCCPDCGHKNIVKAKEDNLSRSAINEVKKVVVNGTNLSSRMAPVKVRRTASGIPYIGLKTKGAYVTIFGKQAYTVFSTLIKESKMLVMEKYIKKDGKPNWKFIRLEDIQ